MGNCWPVIVIDRQTAKQRQLSRQMGRGGSLLFSTDDVVGAVVFGVRSLQRYPVISLHKRSHFTSKPTSRTRLEAASVNNLNRHKFQISPTNIKAKSSQQISTISYMERSNVCMERGGFDYDGAK